MLGGTEVLGEPTLAVDARVLDLAVWAEQQHRGARRRIRGQGADQLLTGVRGAQRQFERRFQYQVGMRPKLYARIARFEAALDAKARARNKSWTEIAHEFGYHDQMHLVHDFGQFSGETPGTLLTELESAHQAFMEGVRLGRLPADHAAAGRLFL